MSKWYENKWQDKAEVVYDETKVALQTVYDALNHGQQQKLLKDYGKSLLRLIFLT